MLKLVETIMQRLFHTAHCILVVGYLVAAGCGADSDDTPSPSVDATSEDGDATTPPGDATSGEDTESAIDAGDTGEPLDVQTNSDTDNTCSDCDCFAEGDTCPPEAMELNCMMEGFGPWCGEDMNFIGGCECLGGTWTCVDMQSPPICHDCCQAAESELHFCATDGTCIEAIACEDSSAPATYSCARRLIRSDSSRTASMSPRRARRSRSCRTSGRRISPLWPCPS